MSRYSKGRSYGHRVRRIGYDHYRLHWTVDRYYPDSNLRWPRGCSRDTDERGARRFTKRWGLKFPDLEPGQS